MVSKGKAGPILNYNTPNIQHLKSAENTNFEAQKLKKIELSITIILIGLADNSEVIMYLKGNSWKI